MTESPEHCELERQKTWSDIYSYSYNESLTGCVSQLEALEKFTKIIVGEKASVHLQLLHSSAPDANRSLDSRATSKSRSWRTHQMTNPILRPMNGVDALLNFL
jgi:hypothetical protein